jgi:superkiller protein 3
VFKASTRTAIAIALTVGLGIVAYIFFGRWFPFSPPTSYNVTQDCGGFLVDDPQIDLLAKNSNAGQTAKLQEKIACYQRQISQDDRYPDAYTNLGEAYRRRGDAANAKLFHQKALQLNPSLQEAQLGLALVQQESGDPKAAIATIQKVMAQKETASGYFYQGITLVEQTQLKEAESSFRKALELDPNYAEARVNLGLVYHQEGKPDQAINELNQAIRINPNLVEAHFNLGVLQQAKGQLDLAIASYTTATRLDPNNAAAFYNLGVALRSKGRETEATIAYKEAIRLNPDYGGARVGLGANLSEQGQVDEAITQFRRAIEINPNDAEAYNNLGVAYHKQNDLTRAMMMWNEAIRLKPNYAEAHHNMGVALATQGKLEEAIANLQKASELYKSQGKTQKADQIDQALQKIGVK